MFISIDAAKSAAKRLQRSCGRLGRPQKLTRCQAAIAEACGYNGWTHLAKTLGTAHAPSAADADATLRRFEAAASSLWPAGAAIDPQALFADAFGHGAGAGDGNVAARVSEAVRSLPASEAFGGRPEDEEEEDRGEAADTRLIGRTVEATMPCGPEGEGLSIRLSSFVDEETAGSGMLIRRVRAWLTRNGEEAGLIRATLYLPAQRGGVSLADASDIADMVSDADVWTVRNIGRDLGEHAFETGVAMIWWWEMDTPERGRGLGAAFLAATMAELKRRHRILRTIAVDPATIEGRPDFAAAPDGASLIAAAKRRLSRYVAGLDVARSFGPSGRLALFDDARHGGPLQTMIAMGSIYKGRSEDAALAMSDEEIGATIRRMRQR